MEPAGNGGGWAVQGSGVVVLNECSCVAGSTVINHSAVMILSEAVRSTESFITSFYIVLRN
jgi:hypothetical protein